MHTHTGCWAELGWGPTDDQAAQWRKQCIFCEKIKFSIAHSFQLSHSLTHQPSLIFCRNVKSTFLKLFPTSTFPHSPGVWLLRMWPVCFCPTKARPLNYKMMCIEGSQLERTDSSFKSSTVGKMLQNSTTCCREPFMKGRVPQWAKPHSCLILRNCHRYPKLHKVLLYDIR